MNGHANIKLGIDARTNSFTYTVPLGPEPSPGAVPDVVYVFCPIEIPPASTESAAPKGKVDAAALAAQQAGAIPQPPIGSATSDQLMDMYINMWRTHGILSIEEPFHINDAFGFQQFREVHSYIRIYIHIYECLYIYAI